MARPKAQYNGDGTRKKTPEPSPKLQSELEAFYQVAKREMRPSVPGDENPQEASPDLREFEAVWGDPVDEFVEAVLDHARRARNALDRATNPDTTKANIRAEHEDILEQLKATARKLRSLSPGFERLLPISADPIECAVVVEQMALHVEAARNDLDRMEDTQRPDEKRRDVAEELADQVIGAMRQHGLKVSATANASSKKTKVARDASAISNGIRRIRFDTKSREVDQRPKSSDAVRILKLVGDDIGVVLSELTWRDIVIRVTKGAHDH